jgi:mono/diheme cytochrome c family protein
MRTPARTAGGVERAVPGARDSAHDSEKRARDSALHPLARSLWIRFVALSLYLIGADANLHAGYRIENIPYPAEIRGGISAVAFTPAGTLVIATRYGEIWMRPSYGAWRLFARGLNEPMGLVAESERVVYIAHRPELLRATDANGDGRAETFDTIAGGWGLTQNYHEFFFGLRRDAAGNFYGAISLESTGGSAEDQKAVVPDTARRGEFRPASVLEPTMQRSEVPLRGWAIKIAPDGKIDALASGFRQPNGVGLSPEGELFLDDNQGDYKPSCGLLHVAPGDFHGHAQSLKWAPGIRPEDLTTEALWRRYKSPAVVFPHGPMGISAGEPVWDTTGGKFGPFAGQVFTGDFSRLVVRSTLEKVAGGWQGACFVFLGRNETAPDVTGDKLLAGVTRAVFAPDGSLYLGATGGWGGGADGLQRVIWDGQASPEIKNCQLTTQGFRLTFTQPMSAATLTKPANYELSRFRFYYQWKYGSPRVDETPVDVREVRVAADGLSAELVLTELKPGFVYELSVPSLRTRAGAPLVNPLGYYTANRLLNGEAPVGGTTRLPRPGEATTNPKDPLDRVTAPDQLVAAGEKTYRLFCVACHQPDGRGIPGGAANFVDDKTRLAKDDAQLLNTIAHGSEAKGMPAFENILPAGQRRAVLAYIRATFGPVAGRAR